MRLGIQVAGQKFVSDFGLVEGQSCRLIGFSKVCGLGGRFLALSKIVLLRFGPALAGEAKGVDLDVHARGH